MTKKEYWEQDFYQIGEYGDTKYIKIDGFSTITEMADMMRMASMIQRTVRDA